MQTAETLSRHRRWLIVAAAAAFLAWQGALAARGTLHPTVLLVIALLAFLLFVGCFIASLRVGRSMRGTAAERALNDEMVQRNRLLALSTGFWAMIGVAAALSVGGELFRLNAGAAAHIIGTVGVVAALIRFALLEGLLERD